MRQANIRYILIDKRGSGVDQNSNIMLMTIVDKMFDGVILRADV